MAGQQLKIVRKSAWSFNTSGTGGIGVGFVAAGGGEVVLNPPTGKPQGFFYGAGGAGYSWGVRKIPKIGRIIDPRSLSAKGGGTIGPKPWWNTGDVIIMDGFHGTELSKADFKGVCCLVEAGGGLIFGFSGSIILVNVNPLALIVASSPMLAGVAPPLSPKAMILSCGFNVGPQASAGVTGEVGYMWPKAGAA